MTIRPPATHRLTVGVFLVLGYLCLGNSCGFADEVASADLEFFEQKIRPVLVEHCYECHAANSKLIRGGLLVDSREGIRKGGDSGPSVVPGDTEESLILQALRHETYEMPPRMKLPDAVIADFELWVSKGAPDPRDKGTGEVAQGVDRAVASSHWAFQPISNPSLPKLVDESWIQSPIDSFVLQKLQLENMKPAPPAEKTTLIRRATFDLIGLPPTVEEIDAFLRDDTPEAFAKVVDRLLASPQYGERWGRHWLDLVRYADTNGADENHRMPETWQYRDWVVRQMNLDLPFDQFLTQQLAGDLLPKPADEAAAGELLTATGMLVIGPKMLAEQDKEKMLIDIVDEQLDTVTKTTLGLTIACARCHDHKFDPISTQDYYALAGIFASTKSMSNTTFVSKWMERPLPSAEIERKRAEHQPKIDAAKALLEEKTAALKDAPAEMKEPLQKAVDEQKKEVEKVEAAMPAFTMVMAVEEEKPRSLPVHIRGNHLTKAKEETPRGMPSILTDTAPAPVIPEDQSGRLELARWLVSEQNPLTSRVMVNRIWMWTFGEGLVRSPSNFGLMGLKPTHPELLDWLAREFMRNGWSVKQMHRTIMLCSTYQMSSQGPLEYAERDPENQLLWRQNRKRLEAEPIRDSILVVGGELELSVGGTSPNTDAKRRAIYLPIDRSALYEMFSTFDYVETANHIEQRPTTIVPHQALFVMNSPLVLSQAKRVASRVVGDSENPETRVQNLFRRLFARTPRADEVSRALAFVGEANQVASNDPMKPAPELAGWEALARVLMASNEFIYVD